MTGEPEKDLEAGEVRWEAAAVPELLDVPARSVGVPQAVLSATHISVQGKRHRIRGAVYNPDGALRPISQRLGGKGGDLVLTDDPGKVDTEKVTAERLPGTWLYGGHWMPHFGHFITETVTNLWPEPIPVDGLVFHRFVGPQRVSAWQREFIRRAGWGAARIEIVDDWRTVDHLIIPSRPVVLNAVVGPEAVDTWNRMMPGRHVHGRPVYLSRSRLEEDSRRTSTDHLLDEEMEARGFDVVHPQELDVTTQMAVAAQAPLLVGLAGSALHLSAFAHPGARTIEIGDRRSPRTPIRMQRAIDAAFSRETAFVPLRLDRDDRDVSWTMARIDELLASL
ncbi:glycosyltransferase family 61 protein [Brevibacterium litoralis]|uniref:glycosyltransferase family 61 protein n=1 Tax=Brevibacterium litoralis TaxID=3138935 RepID=UPI0032EB52B2